MPLPKRPQFKFEPSPSDNEIYGIGLVTLKWAMLEQYLDLCIHTLTGQAFDSGRGQRATFAERAAALNDAAGARLQRRWHEAISASTGYALSIKIDRDHVVHGLWSLDDRGELGIVNAVKGRLLARRLDYGKLKDIAGKIDEAHYKLIKVAEDAAREYNLVEFTLTDAWKAMSR